MARSDQACFDEIVGVAWRVVYRGVVGGYEANKLETALSLVYYLYLFEVWRNRVEGHDVTDRPDKLLAVSKPDAKTPTRIPN